MSPFPSFPWESFPYLFGFDTFLVMDELVMVQQDLVQQKLNKALVHLGFNEITSWIQDSPVWDSESWKGPILKYFFVFKYRRNQKAPKRIYDTNYVIPNSCSKFVGPR